MKPVSARWHKEHKHDPGDNWRKFTSISYLFMIIATKKNPRTVIMKLPGRAQGTLFTASPHYALLARLIIQTPTHCLMTRVERRHGIQMCKRSFALEEDLLFSTPSRREIRVKHDSFLQR